MDVRIGVKGEAKMPYRRGKSWEGQVRFRNPQTGKYNKYRQSGFGTKASASTWEKSKLEELRLYYSNDKKNMQLNQLVLEYLKNEKTKLEKLQEDEDKKAFKSGWDYFKEKKQALERYVKHTGPQTPISTIEPDQIMGYMATQQRTGRSNNSINSRERKHLVAMFSFFEKKYLKQFNPARIVPELEHISKKPYTPTINDILAMLAKCPPEDFHFFMLYLSTGARRSELFRLTWADDVDFLRGIIRLGSRKGKDRKLKYTWVPMAPDARTALEYLHENRVDSEQKYVLVSKRKGSHYGKPFSKRQKIIDMYTAVAGVRRFGFHAMRRVYIQTLGESGAVGINQLRMLARHSSLATTSKYSHTPDPALHHAAEYSGLEALKKRAANQARRSTPAKIIPMEEKRRKKSNGS